jgi:DNA-binding response OmpR family regulator
MRDVKPRLLLVDDDEQLLAALHRALSTNFVIQSASSADAARKAFQGNYDVALLDIRRAG